MKNNKWDELLFRAGWKRVKHRPDVNLLIEFERGSGMGFMVLGFMALGSMALGFMELGSMALGSMALGSMKLGSMDLHFFYDFYPKKFISS